MPTMVRVKCSVCGKEFDRELKSYNINKKRGQNIYCSKECQMAQQKTGQLVHCAYCNKSIYATKHRIEKSKSGLIFCSHSCNASYFNPITKKKEDSGTYRERAFKTYEHKCAICGWSGDERVLEVHHIDENRDNNDLDNLIILCPMCHRYLTLHIYSLEELKKINFSKILDVNQQ